MNKFRSILRSFFLFFSKNVISPFFRKSYIIFESDPDFCDSTFKVYKYFCDNNKFNKYRPIWVVYDKENAMDDCKCINYPNPFLSSESKCKYWYYKLILYYYTLRSIAIICNNRQFTKVSKRQYSFYVAHGAPVKSVKGVYESPEDLDYFFIQGRWLEKITREDDNINDHTITVPLGLPRNDDLLSNNGLDRNEIFGRYNKVVVWYPAFRKHKFSDTRGAKFSHDIPIIYDFNNAQELNNCAKSHNVLLVIKPHFSQDVSRIKDWHLSNLKFIDNTFFIDNHINSYQMLSLTDALLTDFSSIYYDYMLLDRPIGLVLEDMNEYVKYMGVVVSLEKELNGGERIYNVRDLCDFVSRIAVGQDKRKVERKACNNLINNYQDALSTQRVSNYICNILRI